MININHEQLLPINKVPAFLQSRGLGKRVSLGTVYRWIMAGVDGVRLESVRIGGQTVTSAEAIQRWVEAREETRHEQRVIAVAAGERGPAREQEDDEDCRYPSVAEERS